MYFKINRYISICCQKADNSCFYSCNYSHGWRSKTRRVPRGSRVFNWCFWFSVWCDYGCAQRRDIRLLRADNAQLSVPQHLPTTPSPRSCLIAKLCTPRRWSLITQHIPTPPYTPPKCSLGAVNAGMTHTVYADNPWSSLITRNCRLRISLALHNITLRQTSTAQPLLHTTL